MGKREGNSSALFYPLPPFLPVSILYVINLSIFVFLKDIYIDIYIEREMERVFASFYTSSDTLPL